MTHPAIEKGAPVATRCVCGILAAEWICHVCKRNKIAAGSEAEATRDHPISPVKAPARPEIAAGVTPSLCPAAPLPAEACTEYGT